MKYMIHCIAVILLVNLFSFNSIAFGETLQIPQWYKMTANFEDVPTINKSVTLNVDLTAIIGNLENVDLKLLLPEGWVADKISKKINTIAAGKTENVKFQVTPRSYLTQGSVIVEGTFKTPKASLFNAINKITTDKEIAEGMKNSVNAWPELSKRYTNISFAIFPEESFYPISGDMWIDYADEMAPEKGFKGPVHYSNSVISTHQAQTDVEMYNRLLELLKSDKSLEAKLSESGIDLGKKRSDYLMGLYVLAEDSWRNQDYQSALDLLEQMEANIGSSKSDYIANLKIAGGNLRALVFWQQGQKRLAQDTFKKTFYSNRKHKLQRYVLRNIGLLMYAMKDKSTAQQMYRLAADMKKGYTLIDKELSLIK